MKKYFYSILIASSLFGFNANAQKDEVRKNVINLNLTSLAIAHYGLSYERVVAERMSLRLGAQLASYSLSAGDNKFDMSGWGILPEFRYYVSKKGAPRGYFVGAFVPVRSYTFKGSVTDGAEKYEGQIKLMSFGVGFVTGPQWLLGNRVSLAIPFGFSFGSASWTSELKSTSGTVKSDISVPLLGGFMPRFAVELGVAF